MPTRKVADLTPHPENARIYADAPGPDLVESVRVNGVLQPLLVTQDGRVISGHRRLAAAAAAGLEEVPVSVFGSTDELDILQALVESNRQRVKTNEQLGREAEALLGVEKKRAEARQAQAARRGGRASGASRRGESKVVDPVPQPSSGDQTKVPDPVPEPSGETGEARDKVGASLGVSGRTAGQAAAVARVLDALEEAGQDEEAAGLRRVLNQSVRAAYTLAKDAGHIEPAKGKAAGGGRTTRPRKKKAAAPANGQADNGQAVAAVEQAESEGPPPEPGTDALGIPVPLTAATAFADREQYREARSLLRRLAALVTALAQSPGGAHLAPELSRREAGGRIAFRATQLEEFRSLLNGSEPHAAVCPWCYRDHPGHFERDCKACQGLGWVPLRLWRRAPAEDQERVRRDFAHATA